MRFLLISLIFTMLAKASDPYGSIVFSANFDNMPSGQKPQNTWQCLEGHGAVYTIESGGLFWIMSQLSNGVAEHPGKWREGLLNVRIKPARNGGNWLAVEGISGYGINLSQNKFESISIFEPNSQAGPILHEGKLPEALRNAQEYHIQFACLNGRIKLVLNDAIIFDANFPTDQPSGIKLRTSWCSSVLFSDLFVAEINQQQFSNLGQPIEKVFPSETSEQVLQDVVYNTWEYDFVLVNGKQNFVYKIGDVVKAKLNIKAGLTGKQQIEYKIFNIYNDIIWTETKQVDLNQLPVDDEIEFTLPLRGVYRISAGPAKGLFRPAEIVLGAIGNIDTTKSFDSLLAMSPIIDDFHLNICELGGISWLRFHDMDLATYWAFVEPEKDKFRWRDEQIDLARQKGFYIMGSFEATPLWASDAPEDMKEAARTPYSDPSIWRGAWGYPPRNLKDVEDYVRTIVRRYRGKIHAWEVWNEPHVNIFWKGSIEEYVEMSKVIYTVAKQEDPNCIIVGGGGLNYAAISWIEAVIKQGLLDYMDVFGIHGYAEDAVTAANAEDMATSFGRIRGLMREYGREVPIWITESGFCSESFFTDPQLHSPDFRLSQTANDASKVIRGLATCMAYDIEKYFWWRLRVWPYEYHVGNNSESLIEYTGAPKGTFYALAGFHERLGQAKFTDSLDLAPYVSCKLFKKENDSIAIIWSAVDFGSAASISVVNQKKNIEIYDFMNNPVALNSDGDSLDVPISYRPYYMVLRNGSSEMLSSVLRSGKTNGLYITKNNVLQVEDSSAQRAFLDKKKTSFIFTQQIQADQWFQVDLKSYVNMGFADEIAKDGRGGWTDNGPSDDMRDMPTGRQLFCGVPFDVINPHVNNGKSVITLSGSQILNMPERISNIAVGRKASRLYFLHSASWANSSVELGIYRVKFSNGEITEMPIQSTLNTGDWWFPPTETEASQVVPVPTFNSAVAAFRVKYLRIFEWINPNPQLQIDSIDFVSSNKNAVPILIAVSGVSNSD